MNYYLPHEQRIPTPKMVISCHNLITRLWMAGAVLPFAPGAFPNLTMAQRALPPRTIPTRSNPSSTTRVFLPFTIPTLGQTHWISAGGPRNKLLLGQRPHPCYAPPRGGGLPLRPSALSQRGGRCGAPLRQRKGRQCFPTRWRAW